MISEFDEIERALLDSEPDEWINIRPVGTLQAYRGQLARYLNMRGIYVRSRMHHSEGLQVKLKRL